MFRGPEPDSTSKWCFWIFCICSNLITKQSLYFFITGKNRVGVSSTFNDIITSNESLSTIKGREGSRYRAASRSGYSLRSLLFICVAAVAGGLQWFQSGDLTNEALCHFLTANSFSCVYSLPPPTHFTLISSQLFNFLSLWLAKKRRLWTVQEFLF